MPPKSPPTKGSRAPAMAQQDDTPRPPRRGPRRGGARRGGNRRRRAARRAGGRLGHAGGHRVREALRRPARGRLLRRVPDRRLGGGGARRRGREEGGGHPRRRPVARHRRALPCGSRPRRPGRRGSPHLDGRGPDRPSGGRAHRRPRPHRRARRVRAGVHPDRRPPPTRRAGTRSRAQEWSPTRTGPSPTTAGSRSCGLRPASTDCSCQGKATSPSASTAP